MTALRNVLALFVLPLLLSACDVRSVDAVTDAQVSDDDFRLPDAAEPQECELPGASKTALHGGICTVVTCGSGYLDCLPDIAGCETESSDWNCGACGTVCEPYQQCEGTLGCQDYCPWPEGGPVIPAPFTLSSLMLPPGYTVTQHQAASAATLSNGTDVFGFIVRTQAGGKFVETELSDNLATIASAGNIPVVNFKQLFTIPDVLWDGLESLPVELEVTGVRTRLDFVYGPNATNPSTASKDPALLRDEIVSAISGQPLSTLEISTPCAEIRASWLTELRSDNSLITAAWLTCSPNLEGNEALGFAFEDLLDGTLIAPPSLRPDGHRCERIVEWNRQLTGYPISPSIAVAVDGVPTPRSRTYGWNYDSTTNSIVFYGVDLTSTSHIVVSYWMWERWDG